MTIANIWPKGLSLQSLRGRIALLLALAFLPAGMVALQASLSALNTRREAVHSQQGVRTLHSITVARDEVTLMREVARLGATAEIGQPGNNQGCRRAVADLAGRLPADALVVMLARDGTVRCSSEALDAAVAPDSLPLITAATEANAVVLGFVHQFSLTGGAAVIVVAENAVPPGRPPTVTVVARDIDAILNRMAQRAEDAGRFVALLEADGTILRSVGLDLDSTDAAQLREKGRTGQLMGRATQLGSLWATAMPLEDGGLILVEGWSGSVYGWDEVLWIIWAFLAPIILWAAAIAATWFAVDRYVARPLLVLEGVARAYARGESGAVQAEELRWSPLEIASLARALTSMAGTLRGREARLTAALQEERALLLEVNHRVKNNLQLMASILSILARDTKDPAEARGLSRAHDRVQFLALAHLRVYDSKESGTIDLSLLAGDVARALVTSRGALRDLQLDLQLQPVRIRSQDAIPFAFLIGEWLSTILDQTDAGISVVHMSLVEPPPGGFEMVIDADAVDLPSGGPLGHQRLIDAFARQVRVDILRDNARPLQFRMRSIAPVTPGDADALVAEEGSARSLMN
jgi:two-component sensor histidine kinase